MIVCNYLSDTGRVYQRVRPFLRGIDLVTLESISDEDILLAISNYVPVIGYEIVPLSRGFCKLPVQARVLKLEFDNKAFEIEYYEPFENIDWQTIYNLDIKIKTIGERVKNADVSLILGDLTPYG